MPHIHKDEVFRVINAITAENPALAVKMLDAYEDSHPGGTGMSIIQKIEATLDAAFLSFMNTKRPHLSAFRTDASDGREATEFEAIAKADGFVRGVCAALAHLKSSNPHDERQAAIDRYEATLGVEEVEG